MVSLELVLTSVSGFCMTGEHGVMGRILPMTSSVPSVSTMTLSDKWLTSVRNIEMIYDILVWAEFQNQMLNSMVNFGRFRDHLLHLHKVRC